MKKLFLLAAAAALVLTAGVADAASNKKKKKPVSGGELTSEQRQKIHLDVLNACRKKYGPTSVHHVQIDYKRRRYICYIM